MTNRRDVLRGAAALSALPLVAGVGTRWPPDAARPLAIVYDERFAAAVAFARQGERLGLATHGIAGDMTDLWYGRLHSVWRSAPAALAGLTTHGPLFCLERLGWDYGLRLTHRAEHVEMRDAFEHRVVGSQSAVAKLPTLLQGAGPAWPKMLARLLCCGPSRAPRALPDIYVGPVESRSAEAARGDTESLYSWVLAPVRANRPG